MKLFNINFYDLPLKLWRKKGKKYFKKPKLQIRFFYGKNKSIKGKILDIYCNDILWKDKFNSPRYEESPYFTLYFFRRIGIELTWKIIYIDQECKLKDVSSEYWEYLLNYIYYDRPLNDFDVWLTRSQIYQGNIYTPTPQISLNKRGQKEFRNLCKHK